jgi:hypothetical protein
MDHKDNVKDFYSSKQGEVLHIPCKRTHPNVNVSLNIVRQWASKEWAEDNSKVKSLKNKKLLKAKIICEMSNRICCRIRIPAGHSVGNTD